MALEIGPERRVTYRAIVFLAAVLAALGFALMALRAPDAAPELKAQDALARLAPRPARPDVVIVALDAAGAAKYGPISKWPRSLLAAGLRRVEAGKPAAVVLDLALTDRTHAGDEALWRTMANRRNVLLGMAFDADRPQRYTPDDIRSLVFLEKSALAGGLTLSAEMPEFSYPLFEPPVSDFTQSARGVGVFVRETDPDGVLRRSRLVYRSVVSYPASTRPLRGRFPQSQLDDGRPVALTGLPMSAALSVFGVEKDAVLVSAGRDVRIAGNLTPPVIIPVGGQGRMLIRFAPPGAVPAVPFGDVVAGKVKPDFFAGKTVLIGATAPDDPATTLAPTPVGRMPRVEATANALDTILDRAYVRVVSRDRNLTLGVMILLGLVSGLVLMLVSGLRAALVAAALLLAYLILCYALFSAGHLLLPLLPGLLVVLTTFLVGLLLSLGPLRPRVVAAPPGYIPPPPGAVR